MLYNNYNNNNCGLIMGNIAIEGKVFYNQAADDGSGKKTTRVRLADKYIAAKVLDGQRSKMSPEQLRADLGFFEKHLWAPLTIHEAGQMRTLLININSAAKRLGFDKSHIKESSQRGELEALLHPKISTLVSAQLSLTDLPDSILDDIPLLATSSPTETTLNAAPFAAVRKRAEKIDAFIQSHKQEWFAEVDATHNKLVSASSELPRDLLMTEERRIMMLPKDSDPLIGEGGFKTVRKGWDVTAAKAVAVAKGRIRLSEKPVIENARREIAIGKKLSGKPGIIEMFAAYEKTEGREVEITTVLELAEQDLVELLNRELVGQKDREQIALDILEGLATLHADGILHRDIKLENILIFTDPQTGRKRAKFTDFGLACYIEDLTERRALCGSGYYLAPEQANALYLRKSPKIFGTPEADVYIAGIVLGNIFDRDGMPWKHVADDAARYRMMKRCWKPRVPSHVAPIIHKMLDLNPAQRPTAAQALDQMRRVLCIHTAPSPV